VSDAGGTEPGPTWRREQSARANPRAQITLLRHGEPDWNPRGGASVEDPGLTVYGEAQARQAARALSAEPIDAIYVSPYRRARETAAPLAEATGIAPVTVDGIAEIGVNVHGLSQEDVDRYFVEATQRPLVDHWDGWPDSERFTDFHARATGALADVLARHGITPTREHDFTVWRVPEPPPRIVVVAHGGTNAVLCTHLLDVRPVPWEWMRFESQLAAYSILQARPLGPDGHVWSLVNFNELDHLRPFPTT